MCTQALLFKDSFTCFVYSMRDRAQHQCVLPLPLPEIYPAQADTAQTSEHYSFNGNQTAQHTITNSSVPSQTSTLIKSFFLAATRLPVEEASSYPISQTTPSTAGELTEPLISFRLQKKKFHFHHLMCSFFSFFLNSSGISFFSHQLVL